MESRYKRDHGYSYGEMIQKQDALTVSELTEGVFSEWDDKLEIMGSICDFYDYMWRFYPDGRLVLADTILYSKDVKNCEWKGKEKWTAVIWNIIRWTICCPTGWMN